MSRKQRREITKETFENIKRMTSSGEFNVGKLSDDLGICRQTVSRIVSSISMGNEFESCREKRKKTVENRNKVMQRSESLLNNIVLSNNSVIQSEMRTILVESYNINTSNSTISRKLKKLGITRKRLSIIPEERNTQERIVERLQYANDLLRYSNANLVFLDESGFNEHIKRAYGYSLKNQKAVINLRANRGKNISLLCAIDINGVVAYETKFGSFNSVTFLNFLSNKIVPYFNLFPEKVLVMDNVRFHHTHAVKNFMSVNNINYKYLPAYSPQLNPIEEFFSMLKSRVCRIELTGLTINEKIETILREDLIEEIKGFFTNMRGWIETARASIPFI